MKARVSMAKSAGLHIVTTLGLLFLALLMHILPLPENITAFLGRFLVTLFASMAAGILSGEGYAILISLLVPAAAWYLSGDMVTFPVVYIVEAVSALAGGLTAAIFYRAFRGAVSACFAGVLMSRIVYALTGLILSLVFRNTYSFAEFLREGIIYVWPGLVLCGVILPALILLFKANGLMFYFRDEREG